MWWKKWPSESQRAFCSKCKSFRRGNPEDLQPSPVGSGEWGLVNSDLTAFESSHIPTTEGESWLKRSEAREKRLGFSDRRPRRGSTVRTSGGLEVKWLWSRRAR